MRLRTVVLTAVGALVTAGGIGAWMVLRVEDIPEELEPMGDPATIKIDGVGEQPPLDVAALSGKTSFFVWVGIQSFGADEGKKVNRALNRWILPESTAGHVVFNAEGLGFLKEKSSTYMEAFGKETRYPIYGDFEGQFRNVFKLPQGHHALVVLGPDGDVLLRHSGGMQETAQIEELRTMLGGKEPEPGPDVPEFSVGALSQAACAAKPCVLLFLGAPVAKKDIPGIDGGFEGEDEARWAQMKKAEVRVAATALSWPLGAAAQGAIIGQTEDLKFDHWTSVAAAPEAREAFGIPEGATAWVILKDGRVAYNEQGVVQMYRLALFADAVGVEFKED